MDDLDAFLNQSLALLEKKESKSRRRLSSLSIDNNLKKIKSTKPKEVKDDNLKVNISFTNIITQDSLYSSINPNSNKINVSNILSPYFPSDQIYHQEINENKTFLLDKYLNQKVLIKKNKKTNRVSDKYSDIASNLKKEKFLYSDIVLINQIWLKYINSLLLNEISTDERLLVIRLNDQLINKTYDGILFKLLRADMHGSYMIVDYSENYNTIGMKGIVILETKNTFMIITQDSVVKTIMKKGTIFKIPLFDCLLLGENSVSIKKEDLKFIYLNGNGFLYKATERTKAKFRK